MKSVNERRSVLHSQMSQNSERRKPHEMQWLRQAMKSMQQFCKTQLADGFT